MFRFLIWNPVQGPSCEDLQQTIEGAIDNDPNDLIQLQEYIAWDNSTDYASYDYNGVVDNMWKTAEELCDEICADCITLFPCNWAIRQMEDGEITQAECFETCERNGRELECSGFLVNGLSFVMFAILAILRN